MVNEAFFASSTFAIVMCAGIHLVTAYADDGREGAAFLVACLATLCGVAGVWLVWALMAQGET